jgi:hypothetical protein
MQATPDRACAEGVEAADVEALPPLPTFKPQCYIQHSSRDMAANKDMAAVVVAVDTAVGVACSNNIPLADFPQIREQETCFPLPT